MKPKEELSDFWENLIVISKVIFLVLLEKWIQVSLSTHPCQEFCIVWSSKEQWLTSFILHFPDG